VCVGVLHHLENPVDGLNRLKSVLEDDGFISIMVYGKYGRTGIYQMQDLMKIINTTTDNYPSKINNFKNIYKQLRRNNWFKLGEHLISDHNESDEGIVDLILHCQDTSFSVSELYNYINKCNLNIIDFSPSVRYKYKYKINNIGYPDNIIEKYSINELFFGDIIKHSFYISKNIDTKAKIDNLDNILILVLITKKLLNKILSKYKRLKYLNNISRYFSTLLPDLSFFINIKKNVHINCTLTYKLDNNYIWYFSDDKFINDNIEINEITYNILNNIDDKKSLNEIFDIVRKELNIDFDNHRILNIFKPVYEKFELYDMILLKSNNY
jgi:hypothetical protein